MKKLRLNTADLLTRGYFPDRVIPPVTSSALRPAVPDLEAAARLFGKKLRSRSVQHSVPKRKHLRRILCFPNPVHQTLLASAVEKHWATIQKFCSQSPLSISVPVLSTSRAVESCFDRSEQPAHRALRSVGSRYLLKTDLSRFYPSIYTHSIPWAIHGKAAARRNKKLYGNYLDECARGTQDKQTGGIPIGRDTSFVLGEVVASAIDVRLKERIRKLKGTRYIDDYYLYFETLAETERALSILHKVAKESELELNDLKTEITPLPEAFEPAWKAELRGMQIRSAIGPQSTDLLSLFNRGFELATQFPQDSVLTYIAKQVISTTIDASNWELCQSLLLRATVGEPTMLSVLLDVVQKNISSVTDRRPIGTAVFSLCSYHAPLQQGNEVAWALWLAKQLEIKIPKAVAKTVAGVDDDVVALISLDLQEAGLFAPVDTSLWKQHMRKDELYGEHWLLAYEALGQGWLASLSRRDYISPDPIFSVLQNHDVRFYDRRPTLVSVSTDDYPGLDDHTVTHQIPDRLLKLLTAGKTVPSE